MYNQADGTIDLSTNMHMGLNDRLAFGKWKGLKVETVVAKEPSYIRWLLANTQHSFTQEVHTLLNKVSPKRGTVIRDLDDDEDWFGEYGGGFDHGGM